MFIERAVFFFKMDGYAFFVWTAYGFWFFILFLLILKVILRKTNIERKMRGSFFKE